MVKQNCLFEIGTEELPPKSLKTLAIALMENIKQGLQKVELTFTDIKYYATPRRLAVFISDLNSQQPDREVEKKGPAVKAAYDADGKPTPALEGFARSCNTAIDKLTEENGRLVCRYREKGKSVQELLPIILNDAITGLPIPKPMRWSNRETQFVRPVQWVVLLYGSKVISTEILGHKTGNISYGHRFMSPKAIKLKKPEDYIKALKKAYVLADFAERRQLIQQQAEKIAAKKQSQAMMKDALLDEVTGLVEWPVALLADFEKEFLKVPHEALVAAMEEHQRCFPLEDKNQQLLPYFITVSNIESKDPKEVIRGNERVMRARLADAKFFFETDCKVSLSDRIENLKQVVFQAKLGTLFDKAQRIAKLAGVIAKTKFAEIAGMLCKADLVTTMVGEFPELQGVMGYYYAQKDGEPDVVQNAIYEHYLPRYAGDVLPDSPEGCAVALADRIDTLVGIFGINQIPTGDKDPFGLRRAAIAVIRILIEKQLNLNLAELIQAAHKNYQVALPNPDVEKQVHAFILDRFNAWYQDQAITPDTLSAVLAVTDQMPLDVHHRVLALQQFRQLPEAAALAEANKRASNLLSKSGLKNLFERNNVLDQINVQLLGHDSEKQLYDTLKQLNVHLDADAQTQDAYITHLKKLATLQKPVAYFFDSVMVMDEDEKLRHNRLALLAALRQLFLQVADISLLQG